MRDLDIVILTSKRWPLLQKAIASIVEALQKSAFRSKIFVILNGDDPQTEQGLKIAFPFVELILLKEPRNLGAARNAVIPFLFSKWTCFLDDDIRVGTSFFSVFQGLIRHHDKVVVWGGPNINADDEPTFARISGEILGRPWASGFSFRRYHRPAPGTQGRAASDVELTLCNLFVRTDLFAELGFDDGLKGAEENELWCKINRHDPESGARWEPELWVYHKRRETVSAFARQIFKFGFGRGENIRRGHSQFFQWLPVLLLLAFVVTCLTPRFFLLLLLTYLTGLALVSLYEVGARRLSFFWQMFLYPLVHFSYALGVLAGLVFARDKQGRGPGFRRRSE
jgi:hypothetical protein